MRWRRIFMMSYQFLFAPTDDKLKINKWKDTYLYSSGYNKKNLDKVCVCLKRQNLNINILEYDYNFVSKLRLPITVQEKIHFIIFPYFC